MLLLILILATVLTSLNYAQKELGVPDYKCDPSLMAPSKEKPINVNSLRPADINIIMGLGDSLSAGNGARAKTIFGVLDQYRGLSFTMGGDKSLEQHITIPNILRKYNPKLFGQSHGVGDAHNWNVSCFNHAFPGAKARDLPQQAQHLIRILKQHPDKVDIKNDWKLLNIFIGGNDLCAYSDNFITHIKNAILIIKKAIPKVLVNLIIIFHIDLVRQLDVSDGVCKGIHLFECTCAIDNRFDNDYMRNISKSYQLAEKQLKQSGLFESDDFTLVTQPLFSNVDDAPRLANGSVNLDYLAPDCFHFSQLGHSLVSSWVWKNMLEPVGNKTTKANLNLPALPLSCPDPSCPFIRTTENSKNCTKYFSPDKLKSTRRRKLRRRIVRRE
uniref:Phospholipase B1, membrane-associated n=1 Tax=Acrobeloides nanus TaxID=290746 RepID=A0A914DYR3_9BILA